MADDYKQKLDNFFNLVPKSAKATTINRKTGTEYYGEVPSGTPVIPVTKDTREAAKTQIEAAIKGGSIVTNANFQTLTGMTHTQLLTSWKEGGLLTSCNAFVMKAGQAVGVKGLGGFNVEDTMSKMGKRHCWIKPESGEKPQYGDVFECRSHTPGKDYDNIHVGISISVEGSDWYTIEGGQGGPAGGVDKVARAKRTFDTKHVLGWVDMRLLASGAPALPDWLLGNWMIYCGEQNYVYIINRYGEVVQKAYKPAEGHEEHVMDLDQGKITSYSIDTVKIKWDREGGLETFTYDRWNSFPGINERMTGVAADGSAMTGVRL